MKIHDNDLHSLYSTNTVTVIKFRKMGLERNAEPVRMWKREMRTTFWVSDRKGRYRLKDPGTNWRMVITWALEKCCKDAEWIQVAQDRGVWQAFVITVMNFRFS
jgi:hypothetical protein